MTLRKRQIYGVGKDHMQSQRVAKQAAGAAAAALIDSGMTVGIGSGSTATHFIDALAKRCRKELEIQAVATSSQSAKQAQKAGIPLVDIDKVETLHLAIDGADEVDRAHRLIKGGGGALLHEKVVAAAAEELVVIIDGSKLVDRLGTFGLPVEILPFGASHTLRHIEKAGFQPELRMTDHRIPFQTDSGHWIADLTFPQLLDHPEEVDDLLHNIPGLIETGFFFGMTGRLLIGYPDGHVDILFAREQR